jgi:hypothetical protein
MKFLQPTSPPVFVIVIMMQKHFHVIVVKITFARMHQVIIYVKSRDLVFIGKTYISERYVPEV